ncbi:hypothetical protein [uncultured Azohydromonas sp.]|jgi:hypothetical protein|uniref:hypothetical protein n=1 Tax=uncultured Azohydromonas sp. TaxID=487342 RepID=UPI00262AE005|nr:hypothetical protein [uncultured Azohydromonas sp.]
MSQKHRPFLLRDLHFPKYLWALTAVYGLATFGHCVHNAEFLAYYPNMPEGMTHEVVYLAWMGLSVVGLAVVPFYMLDLGVMAAFVLALYGLLGLSGLGHYSLGALEEHTLVANLLIMFQGLSGLALAVRAMRETIKQAHRHAHRGAYGTPVEHDPRLSNR